MLKQRLQQKLLQKLSPQQIQLMKMIQLPTQAFEQLLKQEIEENPALELGREEESLEEFSVADLAEDNFDESGNESINTEDINIDEYLSDDEIPNYRTSSNNYAADNDEKQIPYAAGITFTEYLKSQIQTFRLTSEEEIIADFLIGSIDESGYLRRSLVDIVDDLLFSQNIVTHLTKLKSILSIIQQLDPPGVGAQNLKECLILQLKRKKETPERNLAIAILDQSFDHFVKKHFNKLIQKFVVTENELKAAIKQIEKLNPKPGGSFMGSNKIAEQIIPDFTIRIIDGELDLTLNSRNAPELHISKEYNNMLLGFKESIEKSQLQKDAILFIKQKLDSAKWFIDAILQRQKTLYTTMDAIMQYQKEYFLTGNERKLKPMILKDIADIINMDVSTVSRVANSKYVTTPYGTKLIKDYFSESMKNELGEDVSTKEIKSILATVLNEENKKKPLTDEKLAKILKEKGYPIARRTIAKYREQLDIPVARLRKEI